MADPLIRDVSDTARWVAVFRARETSRPDAVFRDPYAARLAGQRGEHIASRMTFHERHSWSYVARTWLFDRFVLDEVNAGADLVINLAAGLDTRPYRLDLPANLHWVEVDFARLLAYKTEILRDARPRCSLERISLDLADTGARRELFARLGAQRRHAVVLTEGLLIYLTRESVGSLATDLAAQPSFQRWIFDLTSPALLKMIRKHSAALADANALLQFAPEEGTAFFEAYGWRVVWIESMLKTGARLHRLPSLLMRLVAAISSPLPKANRPWSGVGVMERMPA